LRASSARQPRPKPCSNGAVADPKADAAAALAKFNKDEAGFKDCDLYALL
jgi:hypothetical protein